MGESLLKMQIVNGFDMPLVIVQLRDSKRIRKIRVMQQEALPR